MSDFMSIFHGGMEHVRRQRDLEKILVVDADQGGSGPKPLDLDSGVVELVMPRREPPAEEPEDGEPQG